MKKLFLFTSIFLVFSHAVANAMLVDRVVAIVNDDVITLSEVEQEGRKLFQQIARKVPAAELEKTMDQARREVLSSLIDKILVEQRAASLNITVDDKELASAFENMAASNNMDSETLKSRLVAQGIPVEDYQKRLKWQILQSKIINYEIRSKIVVTEDKARQYYQQQQSSDIADGYHILQIGLQWGADKKYADKEEAMAKARELERMLAEHQSFSELAKMYSDLPSAQDGGDLGSFAKEEMADFMRKVILDMKPGQISPIIEASDNTLQILKLLSVKSGEVVERPPFESVKEEIIHKLQDDELDKQFARWLKDIRDQAYIKTIL